MKWPAKLLLSVNLMALLKLCLVESKNRLEGTSVIDHIYFGLI